MVTGHRHVRLLPVFAVLSAALLGCRLNLGGPELPPAPEISAGAATQAAASWTGALDQALTTGQVTVILTEEELTSALVDRIASNEKSLLRSPVVTLRDGVITIYGVMEQDPFEANVRLVVTPIIDDEGRLGFELTSADLGPLPASEGLRGTISDMLSEALAGPMGSLATGLRVTSVAVADGSLAIVAEMR